MKSLKEFGNVTLVYEYHKFNPHKALRTLLRLLLFAMMTTILLLTKFFIPQKKHFASPY